MKRRPAPCRKCVLKPCWRSWAGRHSLARGRVVQQLDALRRARVELAVVAAEHGVEAADGLVAVQHVVRGGHRPFGPATQPGHRRFVVAAVDGGAVGGDICAGDSLHGHDQDVARAPSAGQQRRSGKVELVEPGDVRRGVRTVAGEPVFDRQLATAERAGQQLVRQVVLLPLVGIARTQVLQADMRRQERRRQRVGIARQARTAAAPEQHAKQCRAAEAERQWQVGEAAALGGAADELRIQQVLEVGRFRHAPDRADQFGIADQEQAPEQHDREREPQGASMQEQHQQAAEGQVREIAERRRPAEPVAAGEGNDQEQRGQRQKRAAR